MYTHIQGDLADVWLLDELGNKVEVHLRSKVLRDTPIKCVNDTCLSWLLVLL
jgi:hypothetical protein